MANTPWFLVAMLASAPALAGSVDFQGHSVEVDATTGARRVLSVRGASYSIPGSTAQAIGKAQFAAFSKMLDANTSPVSQNIISGDNYKRPEGEIVALRQKVELLKRLLDEKDKLLEEKDKLIKEKDKQIDLMYILINDKK